MDAGANKLNISKLFYRLLEMDKDGRSNYSGIRPVNILKENLLFSVSPNPARDFINILSLSDVMNVQVKITDISGKALLKTRQNFNAGQPLKVSLSQFPAEVLIITIVSNDYHKQFKIFKE